VCTQHSDIQARGLYFKDYYEYIMTKNIKSELDMAYIFYLAEIKHNEINGITQVTFPQDASKPVTLTKNTHTHTHTQAKRNRKIIMNNLFLFFVEDPTNKNGSIPHQITYI
jgi:hypothetical protein